MVGPEYASRIEAHPARDLDVTRLAVRDDGKRGQITIVVQKQMQFDGSLGTPELRPVKDGQGKVNDADVFINGA